MKKVEIEELQKAYLEMLHEFDKICKDNNLQYVLVAGSALGAVRHKGFIPWDNDIDIGMTRPQYEKLVKLFLENKIEINRNREFICVRNKTLARDFIRYIRYDLKRITNKAIKEDCPYIGLEIFAFDGTYTNDFLFNLQSLRSNFRRKLLHFSITVANANPKRGKLFVKLKSLILPIFRKIGRMRLAKWVERIGMEVDYDKAEYIAVINNAIFDKKKRFKKGDLSETVSLKFEDGEFPVFKNYDIYLKNLYGNYMELPPQELRIPHCDDACWIESDELK